MADLSSAKLIAVDWGTTRLRARLVDAAGAVLAEAASDDGIGALNGSGHEAAFEALVAAWPAVPAIMAGMVGSRQGWREAAYVPCPADAAAIAAAMTRFETQRRRPVAIVPGLRAGERDVMRGEETQIVGLIDAETAFAGSVVLPGTHSKWAKVERGTIADFASFISGELFALLARQSFLRHSVADPNDTGDVSASADFRAGAERARDVPFAATLFSVRVRYLLADAKPADNLAYLSGLVIGGEIAAAVSLGLARSPVRIVAAPALARAYRAALAVFGIEAEVRDGDATALAGLMRLARAAGML
ncbi:MAG: 2-dehydro-3-deoxygalactonokinase [Bauldia sp.]